MMMSYKYLLVGATVAALMPNGLAAEAAKRLAFIDFKFEDFEKNIVKGEQDDQLRFKAFYANLSEKMKDAAADKKQRTYTYLHNLALNELKTKHPAWHEELTSYLTNPLITLNDQFDDARKFIKLFLTRYGAYEEYCKQKAAVLEKQTQPLAQENTGLWNTIKSYVASATDTVKGWFGGSAVKQEATATVASNEAPSAPATPAEQAAPAAPTETAAVA